MKKTLLILCLTSLCFVLTACANADTSLDAPTGVPTVGTGSTAAPLTTDMLPPDMTDGLNLDGAATAQPAASEDPEAAGVTTVSTARRAVEQIEDELERLSEVSDAQVVLAGNSAAVALEFDRQYKGGIDDRLRQIVQERIDGVISGVTNVAITADEALVDQLDELGDRLEDASDMADIQNELNAIINKIRS